MTRQHFDKIFKITIKLQNPIHKNTIKIENIYSKTSNLAHSLVSVDRKF